MSKVITLPRGIAAIASITDRKESTRFALQRIRFESKKGRITIVATNSKELLQVTLDGDGVPKSEAMIEPDEFCSALKLSGNDQFGTGFEFEDESVLIHVPRDASLPGGTVITVRLPNATDGRYPPVDKIICRSTKADPVASMTVDPRKFAQLLLAFAEITDRFTTIEFRGEGKPIVLRAGDESDPVSAIGLSMPIEENE